MASQKRSRRPEPLNIPDDLITTILLRLPSVTSVARAALTCKQWLRVASSPAFLRLVRARNPSAPLLGLFSYHNDTRGPPAFHPARVRHDPDLGAVLRRGDFLLTTLPDSYWTIQDCRGGLLLLSCDGDWTHRRLVVVDPVSGGVHNIRVPRRCFAHCLLQGSDAAANDVHDYRSFRVISVEERIELQSARVTVSVNEYSHTGESVTRPCVPVEGFRTPALSTNTCYFAAMYAAGRIYWKHRKGDSLLCLDSTTMEFSYVRLPDGVSTQSPYAVGETEDGKCCLVSVNDTTNTESPWMKVWAASGERHDEWVLQRAVARGDKPAMKGRVRQVRLVVAGVVLLCTDHYNSGHFRHIAFRLNTVEAEQEFLCRGWAYPYLMAWPRHGLQLRSSVDLKSDISKAPKHQIEEVD